MSRLKYSAKGFIRSLQVSRNDVFAFIEGWSDRYFYDRVCEHACRGTGLTYDVRTAQELPAGTGGKTALVGFFLRLRRRKMLLHEFKGKKLAIIFFLDKDIDDLMKLRRRSKHIIYTEFYELENHLIRQTNLCEVAAAAASLDVESIRAVIGDQSEWMFRAATEWKDWVKLCATAQLLNANCGCTYSSHSQINDGPYGGVNGARLSRLAGELRVATGLPLNEFQAIVDRMSVRIDRIYASSRHDRVFKGKWYAKFLAEDVRRAADGRPYNGNGLETRVHAIAGAKLDFGQAWAGYFKVRISSVIQALLA